MLLNEGNMATLSLSGGHRVISIDLLEKYGLNPVDFTE
jgi:hypothetical protein